MTQREIVSDSPVKAPSHVNTVARAVAGVVDASILVSMSILACHYAPNINALIIAILIVVLVWLELSWRLKGSVGKLLLDISVNAERRWKFYLRETIGKAASFATFGIGFLLCVSHEKRALHDYIAGTRVIIRKHTGSKIWTLRLAFTALATLGIAYVTNSRAHLIHSEQSTAEMPSGHLALSKELPAVLTISLFDNDKEVGQGSGFLINQQGDAVTNVHVLRLGDRAEVQLGDGRRYRVVTIEGADFQNDLVIFRIGRPESGPDDVTNTFTYLPLGDSGPVSIGDKIISIGSPEGLGNTVSEGIVSAVRDGIRPLIQITAPISPGSSGGPLLDVDGKVIGVAVSQFREGQNLNFAIPVDIVKSLRKKSDDRLSQAEFFSLFRSPPGAVVPASESRSLYSGWTGTYEGKVRNISAGINADVLIALVQDGDKVYGCLGVHAPLYGSGPVTGEARDGGVQFRVEAVPMVLEFQGSGNPEKFLGNYVVHTSDGGLQQGVFNFVRLNHERLSGSQSELQCKSDTEFGH